jgi:protein involved in polysaccharide export with SLBB domain
VSLPAGDGWLDSVRNIQLLPDDRIYFRSIPEFHKKAQIAIYGEVVYPGAYPIIEDVTRLSEVIELAGGLTENASLSEARMERAGYESIDEDEFERQLKLSAEELNDIEKEYLRAQSIGNPGRVSVDFQRLLVDKDGRHDIALKNRDMIIIPRLSRTVRVIGKVTRPGLVVHIPGMNTKYYIEQAGGFGWRANKGKIRIIKATSGAIVKPSGKVSIEVGDAIVIPEKRERNWWSTAKDVGIFLANLATVYIVIDQVTD